MGVVIATDGSVVKVRFDDDPEPKLFNARARALERLMRWGRQQRV
jgi:hypothetical protein